MCKMRLICVFMVVVGFCWATPRDLENDAVHYKFEYGVHDPHTKDIKSHWEHRSGHTVKGQYMLKEPDGTIRVVDYSADPHAGFQATVKKEGQAQHPNDYGHHGHGEPAEAHIGSTRYGDFH